MKKRILALVLTVALAVGLVVEAGMPLPVNAAATVPDGRVSDANTTGSYTAAFGDGTSTRYSGRVWTDKTVYTGDAEFNGTVDGRPQTFRVTNDSDFLVAYSALATSTSVSGKMKAPVDVVLVIDNSGSMVNNGYLDDTVKAVNNSIKTLMEMNEHNRVAVVLYDTDVATLLPLGRYTPSGQRGGDYIGYTGYNTIYFYNTVNEKVDYNNPGNTWLGGIDTDDCLDTGSSRGTNIQLGVYTGLNILAETKDTTVEINGKTVQRIPALVLLSDGAATYSYSGTNWWETGTSVQGPGNSAYYGNGMLAMATAQYMKQQVTKHYTGTINESVYAAKVYTVGMGVTSLSGDEKNLAYLTLDPSNHWDNNMGRSTKTAFETYQTGRSVNIDVERRETYTMYHPGSDDITTLEYTNAYYDAAQAEDVVKVFEDIMGDISVSAPEVPTEVAPGEDPVESGYITYTDTIGEYMEVKDVKEILWSGQEFTNPTRDENGNTTTYTFHGDINSPVYGQHNVSEIIIQVTDNLDAKTQTLTVKIPASAIPLRVNTIELNEKGDVVSNKHNNAYPIRVFYDVGMKKDVIVNGKVDPSQVSPEYLASHTSDGKVSFYSNLYTEQKGTLPGHTDKTVGDAKVTFEPADTNPYYFNQEQVPLYTDDQCTQSAPWTENPSGPYYRKVTYYEDQAQKTAYVQISTSVYGTDDFVNVDGKLYLRAGSYRVSNLGNFVSGKKPNGNDGANVTGTADTSYYPTFDEDAAGVKTGVFTVYLGNNGVLSAPVATGNLSITKQVAGNAGETDRDFTFDVQVKNGTTGLNGNYTGTITSTSTTEPETVAVTFTGGVAQIKDTTESKPIALKDGETLTIQNLPVGYTFTVLENNPNTQDQGYVVTATLDGAPVQPGEGQTIPTCTGNIQEGQTSAVVYTNTWDIPAVQLTVTKTVDGGMGDADKDFSFNLTLSKNGENYTQDLTAVKTGAGITGSQSESLTYTSDSYTFTLKHDQKIDIDVPYGYTATVTETTDDGYQTKSRNYVTSTTPVPGMESTKVQTITNMTQNYTVDYLNTLEMVPPSGLETPSTGFTVMMGVAAGSAVLIFGCSFLVWRRRRRDWM